MINTVNSDLNLSEAADWISGMRRIRVHNRRDNVVFVDPIRSKALTDNIKRTRKQFA